MPNDVLSLSGRGQVLAEVGQSEKAIEDFDHALTELNRAIAPSPEWYDWHQQIKAFVYSGRGVALAELGESVSAMNDFDLSITLSPENAWVYYNRAHVRDLARDLEKARSDYETALAKKGPALNPLRRKRAQARLAELLIR